MPKTLLLADDSVTIQKVVGISFASEDVVLVTVDNGTAAVAKAKEVRPDIVLADVVMPGMSGYEVCRAIKADPSLRHVPVLLLTGTFEAFDENKAREVGADGHITKPFEAQALVDTVNARLAAAPPKPAPAPAAAAPAAKAAAPAPKAAAPASLFGDDEPFDFLADETTEPSDVRSAAPAGGRAAQKDALSFEDELGLGDALESEPLETADLTQIADVRRAPALDLLEDDAVDEDAETLPPVDADEEVEPEGPGTTRVLFAGDEPASDSLQSTRVMLGEPEAAGVGTITPGDAGVKDPLADMIGGGGRPTGSAFDVEATDLGDPFADDPEVATPSPATTVLIAPPQPSSAHDDDAFADEEAEADLGREEMPSPRATAAARVAGELPARDDLRNMLEKLAWEAFGDVTDRIVRETVQRVEQIAWEVIPKMTETLIREEIRKLKGESE